MASRNLFFNINYQFIMTVIGQSQLKKFIIMLESVVAKFIAKYLSQYIETIDKSQMAMKLWEGHATFENLVLLPTALSSHQLPFRIIKGTIKHVRLNFPWKKLNSEACIIEIENVSILVELDPDVLIQSDLQAQQKLIHTENQEVSNEDEYGIWQSLINTVIDNARIIIKNIHCRLELNYKNRIINSPYEHQNNQNINNYENNKLNENPNKKSDDDCCCAAGTIIPEMTLYTVDDNNQPLLKVIKRASKVRKQLKLNNLSVYFDTNNQTPINISNFEFEMNKIIKNENHQYILNPFYIEMILLHTRNIPDMLQNILTMTTKQLKFSMDYQQSQIFLYFNNRWKLFHKRRRYAPCARPKNGDEIDFWQYFHRCAVFRNRPNEFRPGLAHKILKFRKKYVKIIRTRETQSNILHPILDSQLKTLDNKVGSTAALFCREYAMAVVEKEKNVQESGITAFDMSELKSLLQTTDKFFDSASFSMEMKIPSFQIELLYEKDDPFLVIEFQNIFTKVTSMKGGADLNFSIQNMNMFSFVNSIKRSIVTVEFENQILYNNTKKVLMNNNTNDTSNYPPFFRIDIIYPSTTDPFQMNVIVEPITTTVDTVTLNKVADFFDEKNLDEIVTEIDQTEKITTKVNRIDVADQLQRLLYFKNHILNVEFKKLQYIFPFVFQGQDTSMKFALKDIKINKTAVGLLPIDVKEIKMDFKIHFTIDDLMIDNCCILNEFSFDLPFYFKYFTGTDHVYVDCCFNLGKINFHFDDISFKLIAAAINYSKEIKLKESQKMYIQNTPETQTVMSFGKITTNLDFNFEEWMLNLDNAKAAISLGNISFSVTTDKGNLNGSVKIRKIKFIENEIDLLRMSDDSVEIALEQKNEEPKIKAIIMLTNPQITLDLRQYKRIYLTLINISNNFLKEINYNSSEEINSANNEKVKSNLNNHLTNENRQCSTNEPKDTRHKALNNEVNQETVITNEENKGNNDGMFDISFLIENMEVIIPDKKGDYLITMGKILIKDKIEMEGFGCFRESRIVIKPMNIILYFDQLKNMKLSHLDSQLEPTDLWAILRLVDEIRYFFKDDEPSEEESKEYEESRITVSFESSRFDLYHFEKHILIARTDEVKIEVRLTETEVFTTITINKFKSNQFINGETYKFADFEEPIICTYWSDEKDDTYDMIFPETTAYITGPDFQYIFRWIPDDDDLNDSIKLPDAKSHYTFSAKFLKAVMVAGCQQVGILHCNDLKVDLNWVGNSRVLFELRLGDINGYTDLLGNNFHFINVPNGFYLRYSYDWLLITADKAITSFNIPLLIKIVETLIEILSDKDDDTPVVWDFGMDIEVNEVIANLYPLDLIGPHCHGHINNTKVVWKCDQRNAAISIDYINIDVENANPDRALEISNAKATLSFNEKYLNGETFDDIYALKDIEDPHGFILKKVQARWSASDITINYTHRFAAAVILCCLPKDGKYKPLPVESLNSVEEDLHIFDPYLNMQQEIFNRFNFKLLIKPPVTFNARLDKNGSVIKEDSLQNTNLFQNPDSNSGNIDKNDNNETIFNYLEEEIDFISDVFVDSFHLVLYLIDPLATVEFLGLTASLKDKTWLATMRSFSLFPSVDRTNSLVNSPIDTNLLKFKQRGDTFLINLAEMELSFDYVFYLTVVNFVLRSPFFYIADLQNHNEDTNNSQASLPFTLKLKAPKLRITIPTAIDEKDMPLFHVDMNCYLSLADTVFMINVSDFSVHFSDQITKDHYVPLFENFSIKFIRKIANETDTELSLSISSIEVKLSAADFILFNKMANNLAKATEVLMFSEDNTKLNSNNTNDNDKHHMTNIKETKNGIIAHEEIVENKMNLLFSSVTFFSETIRIIICKDNRTSTKYIPLFNLVIPPISFNLSNTDTVGSMELHINPYVEYYNDSTGFWDMIIEPINLVCLGVLTKESFQVTFKIDSDLNINLPLIAITQYFSLFDDIQKKLLVVGQKYIELPNFWIENQLGGDVLFRMHEPDNNKNYFILNHGSRIPVFSIEETTKIYLEFREKQYCCSPRFLTYPTFLSCDVVAVRRPYKGGIILKFKSPTEIKNNLDFDVNIYYKKDNQNSFTYVGTAPSKKRCPIVLSINKTREFIIMKKENQTQFKHVVLNLSKYTNSTISFLMGVSNYGIMVNLSVQNEMATGTKLFTLYSSHVMVSNLPIPVLKIIVEDIEYKLPNDEKVIDMLIPNKSSTFTMKVSIDGENYGPLNRIKIKEKAAQMIQTEYKNIQIAVIFEIDTETKVSTAIFYSPCVIYNFTTQWITVFDNFDAVDIPMNKYGLWTPNNYIRNQKLTTINLRSNSSKDVIQGLDIQSPRNANAFVFRDDFIKESKIGLRYDISMKRNVTIVTLSSLIVVHNYLKEPINLHPFDSSKNKIRGESYSIMPSSDLTLTKMTHTGLFKFSMHGYSSSPTLSLITEQKTCFRILADLENSKTSTNLNLNLNEEQTKLNIPITPKNNLDNNDEEITENSKNDTKIESTPRSNSISSFQKKNIKSETKVYPNKSKTDQNNITLKNKPCKMIIIEVIDAGTCYEVSFKYASFPTPIVIENCLSTRISAYQIRDKQPFNICSHSTSLFAYDEPLAYPSIHFIIGKQKMHISMIEETNLVETKVKSINRRPVFVEVKKLINGSLSVLITDRPKSAVNYLEDSSFFIKFNILIKSLHISLIDLNMREIALITLEKVISSLDIRLKTRSIKASIHTIQIDDQDISAPNPVCLVGRSFKEMPFLRFEALLPSDVPFPSQFTYASAVFQRVDALLDSAFISDFIYLFLALLKPFKTTIGPQQKSILSKSGSTNNLSSNIDEKVLSINLNWLEMSPIYVLFGYNRKSGRVARVHNMFSILKYIPSLSPDKLLLPGVLVAHVDSDPNSISERISSEYKTAAFKQILLMLGKTGSLLTTFGVTSSIAELLGVKIESNNMITNFDQFSSINSEEFDNRKDVYGPFSTAALRNLHKTIINSKLNRSDIVITLANASVSNSQTNAKSNDNQTGKNDCHNTSANVDKIGLSLRELAGNNGVLGVMTKTSINPQTNLRHMAKTQRKRVPRPFLNNTIEPFDEKLAQAQKTLKNDRIKMSGIIDNHLTVITDKHIIVLSTNLQQIRFTYDFAALDSLKQEGKIIHFTVKKDSRQIECENEEKTEIMYSFIQSQRLMILMFEKSLIE
ncbi:hypothetical protein TRFO_17707 [Tritrichomonas foetus]|uniref:Chorein N-terminal domain-containing protein n=1 Tax=Tritrichomonas foetus TaxID=1144522 RepID=A0A1J4KMA0_9EUKA|nr:hypothetical protein TRFO_17707 [Tritrichomonas foetus]|eukprot:OHT12439.1 hypothetical protein TRFO_17707 [Tritrichomonas foetus]